MRFVLDNDGVWKRESPKIDSDGNECFEYTFITITDVPVVDLLTAWEDLVFELSEKEVEYLNLKEHVKSEANRIELETDFKALYGKNNADIRKQHIRLQLEDEYGKLMDLEVSINWIRSYIPLLKEVIRCKQ